MSMNKFMHPRNIYKTPPDFKQLAIDYEDFRSISKIDLKGNVHIDFKDEEALRTLTRCLLKKDFGLDMELPENFLIPTLPLRLNYILWIEDILNKFHLTDGVGVDIGCGASCIYPLLAVTQNKTWKMYATEVNLQSIKYARVNIERNNLQNKVILITELATNEPFTKLVQATSFSHADFTMCNPPFFDENQSDNESESKQKNRTGKRKPAKHTQTGSSDEIMTAGGEVDFVIKMIKNSKNVCGSIKIFTTMLGHKTSLTAIQHELWQNGITNFCSTEFCQGQTTRWGIAWTFHNKFLLRTVPNCGQNSLGQRKSMSFTVTDSKNIEVVYKRLMNILKVLDDSKIVPLENESEDIEQTQKNVIEFHFIANKNSWSNQRRKRREAARVIPEVMSRDDRMTACIAKEEPSDASQGSNEQLSSPQQTTGAANFDASILSLADNLPLLHVNLKIIKETNIDAFQSTIFILLEYLNGSARTDGAYQLLQYIINKWKNVLSSA